MSDSSPSPTRSGLESDSSPSPRTRVPIYEDSLLSCDEDDELGGGKAPMTIKHLATEPSMYNS